MTAQFTPPPTDPWKGFRGVMAGTLILEVIVVALAFPVVAKLTPNGVTWASGLYLGIVTLILLLLSGRQGKPHALEINLVMQLFVIGGGFIHWSIAVVGAVFACVWIYIAYIKRDVAKRIEQGRLPGQQAITE
ncbi:DUF4233 domain-containing protein [Gordonia sp. (in: high G+C Gram-positive bacteria)]|uniref:DUF4233 domain-containing protein n=1 Tax=Gordonia sp. (in: high G+C Gram-positive bacteria) TaxID=84139 RepID=UPI00169853F9|nr:DUF4233 domain-containing protein [Gordonia sp. (in: high G+C Gram-positive bacteria)]NLG45871.1 DUF4233 domain-containing protein [Gordonia sp. (in: high G+C Gram-positive bacteria)]